MERLESRRRFLKLSAMGGAGWLAAGCSSGSKEATTANRLFDTELGAQLYTLRTVLPEKPREILSSLANIGYTQVEILRSNFSQIVSILQDVGLKPVSGHFETPLVTGKWEAWERSGAPVRPTNYDWSDAVAEAHQHNLHYMVIPYLMPGERGDLDYYRQLSDQLNRAGETCRTAGISLCYHNHAFEFDPAGGLSPFDVLMERLDKNLVSIELDVFWASVAGHSPAELLRKHAGRIPLLHLKDKSQEVPHQYNEQLPPSSFKEVGSGSLDFASILQAALSTGVKHYFVEQDHCPVDPLESLRVSYQYLRSLKL